jgi:hypothetical protein
VARLRLRRQRGRLLGLGWKKSLFSWEILDFHRRKSAMFRFSVQWEFQDPKVEVLYHIRAYFVGVFLYIGLI